MDDFGLLVGKHLTTLPTLSDTDLSELQLDSSGRLIISGRYLEDAAHTSGDAGIFVMGVRNDAGTSLVDADGDYSAFSLDENGSLRVTGAIEGSETEASIRNCTEPGGASQDFVDGDVTVGTDNIAETGHGFETGQRVQLTTTGTLPAGLATATDYYIIRVDADNYKLAASLADAEAGTAVDITAAAGGGTHTTTVQESTRQALDVAICGLHREDDPHTSGDKGFAIWGVRQDTQANFGDDGDYVPFSITSDGKLRVDADVSVANGSDKVEDTAHTTGDTGTYVLAVRQDTLSSSVDADGDYGSFKLNNVGELYVTDEGSEALLNTINTNIADIEVILNALSHAEDSVHTSGDEGIMSLAVRNDAGTALAADGDYIPLSTDSTGALRVTTAGGGAANKNEDAAHVSGDTGNYVLTVRQDTLAASTDADGDYQSFKTDSLGRLYVTEQNSGDILTELQGLSHAEDAAHVSGDLGMMSLAVRNDTKGALAGTDGDYIPFQMNSVGELYVTDEDVEALLTTIDADTGNILTEIQSLTHAEDAAHVSGDTGMMALAVRKDTLAANTDADGDYSSLLTNASGELYVTMDSGVQTNPIGSEAYTVTDALAAAGDGLISVSGTFTTVATLAVGAGTTAYLYAYQWAADKNCEMQIVTDDTSNVIVYKFDTNSSAMPGTSESWSDGGRIEIPGAANLEIKMQIKRRSGGGTANATGSMHIRTV